MKKIKKKHIIIGAIGLLIIFLIFRDGEVEQNFASVERGNLYEELFETGSIKKGEDLNLSFSASGRVEIIHVNEGERVEKGSALVKMEDESIRIQMNRVLASLEIAEINYDRVVSGADEEDIEIVKNSLLVAEKELSSAFLNLEKVEKLSDERMKNVYGDSFSALNEAFIKSDSAYEVVDEVYNKYFTGFSTEDTRKALAMKDLIKESVDSIKSERDIVRENDTYNQVYSSLNSAHNNLKTIFDSIETFLEVFEKPPYRDALKTDTDSLALQKSIINQLISSFSSLIGSVSLTNSQNEIEFNTAQSRVSSAQGAVNQLKIELEKIQSSAKDSDLNQARAQINQVKSELNLLEKALRDTVLRAPTDGLVSSVLVESSEMVAAGTPIINFISEKDLQVEIFIYEGDIPKLNIGNDAEISFVAFPNKKFEGEVVFINPTGEIRDGVVYYKTILTLDTYPEETMIGMTVDVIISTDKREDVLIIPERSVIRESDKRYVMVLGEEERREVSLGLSGEGRMVEVLSGLKEGEKISFD